MYTKRQFIRKAIIGICALAVAICITIFIRENMDIQTPERALPTITITMDNKTNLSSTSIFRAAYEWSFLTTTAKHTPPYTTEDLQLAAPPVLMAPRTYLDISFSIKPKNILISRADESNLDAFMDLVDVGSGPIITPATPGLYLYRLQADFGWRGSILYFFAVQIQDSLI